MIDLNMAKALLDKEQFERVRERLSPDMFGEDVREFYEVITEGHEQTETNLTEADLIALWQSKHPVASRSSIHAMRETVDDIMSAKTISPDVMDLSIGRLWRRKFGTRIANLALQITEGDDDALDRIKAMLVDTEDNWGESEFGPETPLDLASLIDAQKESGCFKFNIKTVADHLPGAGRKQFGIVFATPNAGKTAFGVSLAFAPGGFISQGYKVLFLGNEESTDRTAFRAYQAYFGLEKSEVFLDEDELSERFLAEVAPFVKFKDIQEWTITDVSKYIKLHKPDVVIIDQLDKVSVTGNYEAGHERIRELYRQARELAKTHNCLLLGVSQSSNDAKNRTQLTSDMMEGSKIGKAAEADFIFGVGMMDIDDPTRYITISKNKLTGWHGTIIARIEALISRYTA